MMDNIVRDWENYKPQQVAVATGVTTSIQEHADQLHTMGWNAALEMAAYRLVHDHKRAFGEDTLISIAVWLKEMKK